MAKDPAILAHQEWLGYVQPSGLVVSIPALIEARAYVNRNISPDHRRFLDALPTERDGEPVPEIVNFPEFARSVFGGAPEGLCGAPDAPALPESLEATLPVYGETLRPTYALHDFQPTDPSREWILLVEVLPTGTDLDGIAVMEARRWQASPQARFERLLRETGIPTGLLVNGRQIRLVYAPRMESSGYIAAGNHGVNEIWSNKHCKWFVSDAEFDGHFEKGGIPLSALEIRDEYLKDKGKDVDLVVGPERRKIAPRLLFSPHCYRFVAYELTGDRHTQSGWSSGSLVVWEDQYFKANTWHRWAEPSGGKAAAHWALRQHHFVRLAHRDWIAWTPNVTNVKATVQGGVARVRLHSHTPNFDRYEMNRPPGRWERIAADLTLGIEGPRIEREFRSVNAAGVAGPVSRLLIERE